MKQFEKLAETEIIERILKGEKSLYELIVRRFNPYLYKIGRSYNYNHEDTQDLMQETFIDAYKSLLQFEGRANFKTWIIRIMMNNCYRKREKSSFKNEIMQDANEHSTPLFTDKNNDTDKIIQNRELGNIIEKALVQIPLDYRMVFSLREINGLNVSETAEMLNISEANVKVRLNRAKTMLRSEIENSYSVNELFEFNLIYCDAMVENIMKIIDEL
ncbi:sigma-70 family RNA polymerase sigma factor [Elizabethkingia bruuniana]|uniref:Sigma-70 family RNA polymerase sigma factor n=2 Tax=Elizabethkingia TaxID=308865 RepID=A0A7T7UZB2_9FLAO|nr:sigma-70 family RNA polymerase sigma factor [Elizabethkingia bruuniana]KGO09917.1 RNA polymerase subunit sigma-24 [Elizabethkingia miricola]MCT3940469.1 sigma-70 family RNA polymerase sigma factor [Elizabethkingia anophelis]MCT4071383.1 sigma-70 family RNA polymerase sigma factor [Elizabethkingia anophelis]MCT4193615.1 sigma-70 family RNA polymerase sigma factor [Elizabethkingia anophelis]MDV2458260.1 RNA polymerase subunit sigma-24 [Elizabethkingia anophelis]